MPPVFRCITLATLLLGVSWTNAKAQTPSVKDDKPNRTVSMSSLTTDVPFNYELPPGEDYVKAGACSKWCGLQVVSCSLEIRIYSDTERACFLTCKYFDGNSKRINVSCSSLGF